MILSYHRFPLNGNFFTFFSTLSFQIYIFLIVPHILHLQFTDAVNQFLEGGITEFLHLKVRIVVVHLLGQLTDINACHTGFFYYINHKLLNLFRIIFQNDVDTCVVAPQFKIIQILNKAGQGAVAVIADIKIRVLFHQRTSNLAKAGIPPIIFIGGDDLQYRIGNFLFGNRIFLFLFALFFVTL